MEEKRYDIKVELDKKTKSFVLKCVAFIETIFIILQIVNHDQIAAQIFITLLIHIPIILILMFFMLFRVTVKGNIISVRNWRGKRFNITPDEIKKVIIRQNITRITEQGILQKPKIDLIKEEIWREDLKNACDEKKLEKITIKTKKGSFSVETLMKNFEKFSKYIIENVSEDKIEIIKRDFRPKNMRGE